MTKRKAEELSELTLANTEPYFHLRYKAGIASKPDIELEVSSPCLVAAPMHEEDQGHVKKCPPQFIEGLKELVTDSGILACDSKGWPSPTHLTQELTVKLGDAYFECKTCKTGTATCPLADVRRFEGLDVFHKLGQDIYFFLCEHDFQSEWCDWEDTQKQAYIVTLLASENASSNGKVFVQAISLGEEFDIELDGYDTVATVASKIRVERKLPLTSEVHLLTQDGEKMTEAKLGEMSPGKTTVSPQVSFRELREAQKRYAEDHRLELTNDAADRDAQPEAGIDAALGHAFSTAGRANCN